MLEKKKEKRKQVVLINGESCLFCGVAQIWGVRKAIDEVLKMGCWKHKTRENNTRAKHAKIVPEHIFDA